MVTNLLFVAIATLTPTQHFVAKSKAPTTVRLLKSDFQVMEERRFNLTGDKRPERVVLVGRIDSIGMTHSHGIMVCRTSKSGLSVIASAVFAQNSAYSRTIVSQSLDLDQDGHIEIAIDERAAGGGFSVHGRTYWKLDGIELFPIHYITLKKVFGGVSETSEFKIQGQHRILEKRIQKITMNSGKQRTSVHSLELVYDTWLRRFAPLWVRMLR